MWPFQRKNEVTIQSVGQVRVTIATLRGYEAACRTRLATQRVALLQGLIRGLSHIIGVFWPHLVELNR